MNTSFLDSPYSQAKSIADRKVLRGPEFSRRWRLYLHSALAVFFLGDLQPWQTVLSKDGDHHWPLIRQIELDATPANTLRRLAPSATAKQNSPQIAIESFNPNLS